MPTVTARVREHAVSVAVFLGLWATVWLLTVDTWETDPAGYSIGMSPVAIPLHFLLPLALGVLVSFWWDWSIPGPWRTHVLFGLGFGAGHLLVLWLADWLWLPATAIGVEAVDWVAEAAVLAVVYGVISVSLTALGGWLVAANTTIPTPERQTGDTVGTGPRR
ncbi:MAG: hypothetical protein ACLFWM_04800 [Actinomycetota bacterium]